MSLTARVLLPLPLPPFSFLVPFGTEPGPVGGRVVVPWQGGLRTGICTGVSESRTGDGLDLKELVGWLDEGPFFTPGAVELFAELAGYSGAPEGLILAAFALSGLDEALVHEVQLLHESLLASGLTAGTWQASTDVPVEVLEILRAEGLISERVRVAPRLESQLVATAPDTTGLGDAARAANQRQALELLLKGPQPSAAELARAAGVPASSVRSLVSKGLAEYRDVPAPEPVLELPQASVELRQPSLDLPDSGWFNLTGGLRRERLAELRPLLERELSQGRSPLLLAPELTYLHEAVSALAPHVPLLMLSGDLNDAQRAHVFKLAAGAEPMVLAGTAPALLLKARQPGSIIMLESASSSWKQLSGARLFIPEAARRLARIESRRLIETEVTENAELRASGTALVQLPAVEQRLHVTDLNSASSWPLDADLVRVLGQVQERGRQALILSSRRGFSGALSCAACGNTIGCPNCDLPLRYHQKENVLRCHQCNHARQVPQACPDCGQDELQPSRAAGTQWLATAVSRMLPELPVIRYDTDVREDPEALLAGEPGVLIATTAALRLPPLPNVSLIAVSLFDAHMSLSDFRAAEATLRLMLQLPELTTRQRPLVLLQSFQPDHPVLQVLQSDDLQAALAEFVGETVDRREAFAYPPFAELARIEITARDQPTSERAARRLHGALLASGAEEDELLGPVPAGVARVRGRFVWQLLLRCRDATRFRSLLREIPGSQDGARIRVDVDPRDVSLQLE